MSDEELKQEVFRFAASKLLAAMLVHDQIRELTSRFGVMDPAVISRSRDALASLITAIANAESRLTDAEGIQETISSEERLLNAIFGSSAEHEIPSESPREQASMTAEPNPYDAFNAINEARREAREHTDSLARELREQADRDRKDVLKAISESQERIGRQLTAISAEVTNTRTELQTDIQKAQAAAEANAQELLKINTFGKSALIFISVVGTVAAVVGTIAAVAAAVAAWG